MGFPAIEEIKFSSRCLMRLDGVKEITKKYALILNSLKYCVYSLIVSDNQR